jgi:hypothetical protein
MSATPDKTHTRTQWPGPLRIRRYKGGKSVYISSGPYRGSVGMYVGYSGDGYARVALEGIGEFEFSLDSLQAAENDPLRVAPEGDALVEELFGYHGAHVGLLE